MKEKGNALLKWIISKIKNLGDLEEYDEHLVKRLIEKMTVFEEMLRLNSNQASRLIGNTK